MPPVRAATSPSTEASRCASPAVRVCKMLRRSSKLGFGISYLAPKRRTIAASSAE